MLRKILPALALLLFAGTASATVQTASFIFTATGNTTPPPGQPINAEADFTFNNLTLTVTLTNLLPNPSDIAQNITDFSFQLLGPSGNNLNPGCTTADCLTLAHAPSTVTVAKGGSYTPGGSVDPNWTFTLNSGVFLLNGLGGGIKRSCLLHHRTAR